MKMCLVIPSSLILSDDRMIPRLGILKVAAMLRRNQIDVDLLDLSGVARYLEVVGQYCQENNTDIFGITATSPQLPASGFIAETIRRMRPSAKLVLGGPHGTLVNAAYRREREKKIAGRATRALRRIFDYFDVLVAGDGERAVFDIFQAKHGQIIDADNRNSSLFLKREELENLPFPARDLIDLGSYRYLIDGAPTTSVIAQLGCPFGCGFCGGRNTAFLRTLRFRSADNVIAELREVYRFMQTAYKEKVARECGAMFYDDELNIGGDNLVRLMNAIISLGKELDIKWRLRGFIKAELFNDRQATAMYEAGFREIMTGFESGSPRILRNINKRATLEDNYRCAEIARRNGLRVKALMSIGHPGETEKTIKETKDFILQVRPESFDLTRITVYPGTPYYDEAEPVLGRKDVWVYRAPKTGDKLYSGETDYFSDFMFYKGDRGDRKGLGKVSAFTETLSADDLRRLRNDTERELREKLNQPYQIDVPENSFDVSKGKIPHYILRSTVPT